MERPVSRIIVVLPAYNEQDNLPGLLQSLAGGLPAVIPDFQILVVDDGSSDRTPEILKQYETKMPLRVHRHDRNQGLGVAIRDGLTLANQLAGPDGVIITMDADETHSPDLIQQMIRKIEQGHDVVIASRYQPGARVIGLSTARRVISYLASMLMRSVFPTPGIRDYTCGYRAYRSSTLSNAFHTYGGHFLDQEGFQCMVDILLKLRRMPNIVFGEVPLVLRYDAKRGPSKLRVFRTTRKTLALLLRRRLGL